MIAGIFHGRMPDAWNGRRKIAIADFFRLNTI